MLVCDNDHEIQLSPGGVATFGRAMSADLGVGRSPQDQMVSRAAGRLVWDGDHWWVENSGSRSFFIVEPCGQAEVPPVAGTRRPISWSHSWLRFPGSHGDHAVVLTVPAEELPAVNAVGPDESDEPHTIVESPVTLTENERRSIVSVYEGYLKLPPFYDPQPRSWRAAAARLRVEEGKVRADHRRVAQKVARSGGPDGGGSRYRDGLICWLMSRGVVQRADLVLVG